MTSRRSTIRMAGSRGRIFASFSWPGSPSSSLSLFITRLLLTLTRQKKSAVKATDLPEPETNDSPTPLLLLSLKPSSGYRRPKIVGFLKSSIPRISAGSYPLFRSSIIRILRKKTEEDRGYQTDLWFRSQFSY